jgi:hypothetical protein
MARGPLCSGERRLQESGRPAATRQIFSSPLPSRFRLASGFSGTPPTPRHGARFRHVQHPRPPRWHRSDPPRRLLLLRRLIDPVTPFPRRRQGRLAAHLLTSRYFGQPRCLSYPHATGNSREIRFRLSKIWIWIVETYNLKSRTDSCCSRYG